MTHPFRILLEKVKAEIEVQQIDLPVKDTGLSPVLSKEAVDLHYGVLYKNYVKKALDGEGDFQLAGAKLHTLFFEQVQTPKQINNPNGAFKTLITQKFGDVEKFKESFTKTALGIHGSGWVYVDTRGVIRTITNHKVVDNVAVIIDMWEHSYIIDYGADKERYLKEIWKIINWNIVNARLNG
jgi:Fe-Mn family superoxide dismutase